MVVLGVSYVYVNCWVSYSYSGFRYDIEVICIALSWISGDEFYEIGCYFHPDVF